MADSPDASIDRTPLAIDDIPQGIPTGSSILLACAGDPTQRAIGIRLLVAFGYAADTALVVTTTQNADQTVGAFEQISAAGERPSLGLVDTVSKQQSISSLYGDPPVVFTPSPGDTERLVVGLDELTGDRPPSSGERHLLVRSLTPILETASTDRVCTVLQQVTGICSEGGTCLLGLDATAHDESTITALADRADGILWVTHDSEGTVDYEYRPARGRYDLSRREADE